MVEEKEVEEKKSALMTVKEFLSVNDTRAVLAFMVTLGGFLIIIISIYKDAFLTVSPSVIALIMLVLEWFFKHKEEGK